MSEAPDSSKIVLDSRALSTAALSICESLVVALNDLKLINDKDAHNVLADAAESHRVAAPESEEPALHVAVAEIIERIMNGRNSVRKI